MFKNKKENEYNYFNEFVNNAKYSLECVILLNEVIKNYQPKNFDNNLIKMHELENKADSGKHAMINYLMKDFLPPIEREDIINLSQKIDDLTDFIEEILLDLNMFNISKIREDILEFIDLLKKGCELEQKLLNEFKNFKKSNSLSNLIIEINELEEKADKMYFDSMKKLYRDGSDTVDIMKWTTIYNCIEDCFDTCENIANDVESIILKNL